MGWAGLFSFRCVKIVLIVYHFVKTEFQFICFCFCPNNFISYAALQASCYKLLNKIKAVVNSSVAKALTYPAYSLPRIVGPGLEYE